MRVLLTLCLVAACIAGAVASTEDYTQRPNYVHPSVLSNVGAQKTMWSEWKLKHNRDYASHAEEKFRFSLFQSSLHRVVEKNNKLAARGLGPNYGINKFSDMAPEEWSQMYLVSKEKMQSPAKRGILEHSQVKAPTVAKKDMPTDLDWRELGVVTFVKDQGQCGSCWAFSTCETVESAYGMKNNATLFDLSEQQIVDCDWGDGNQGCDGGDPSIAYAYVMKTGLMSEDAYPYLSGDAGINGTCVYKKSEVVATIANFSYATPPCFNGTCSGQNDILLAQNIASHGPAGIIVDASQWQDYTWGSFSDCSSDYADMDHGVQVVGYLGLTAEHTSSHHHQHHASVPHGLVGAWLVRNSWGEDWGDSGYITFAGSETGNNMCGISNEAIFVDL